MNAAQDIAVEFRNVSKRFGEVLANDRVSFLVPRGIIHGIIGENGAGKSTAMKLLYGMYRPDSGQILLNGKPCSWKSPADAIASRVGMVHQHFMLAGAHSALDNILLGTEPTMWGFVDRRTARSRLESLAAQYGLTVDFDRCAEDLPVGVQQRVEILKLLYRDAEVLILDEPTAVLTPQEITSLFANLKRLCAEGKTILLVTHKLKEVMACSNRVTVFRAGQVTGEVETVRTSVQELANLMVGRRVILSLNVAPAKPVANAALEVEDLSLVGGKGTRRRLVDINFSVKRGEIVGVAGVEGNGQTEMLDALLQPAEPRHRTAGKVCILGQDVTDWPAYRIRALGVAVIPQDRIRDGLLPDRPLSENFLLGLQRSSEFCRAGRLRLQNVRAAASTALQSFDVRPLDLDAPAGTLSGGNQQKLILAREFERQPRLLIAAQPTRGVDVGAIEAIHRRIVQARDAGAGVLLVSSELDEVLALSDRILVMYEGRLVAEFPRGAVSERQLGLKMGGA